MIARLFAIAALFIAIGCEEDELRACRNACQPNAMASHSKAGGCICAVVTVDGGTP